MQDSRLLRLKKAIYKGNFRARIWNNSNCNLYLIYLIQEKMIPFWQGITAYVYLIAKMQYTKTQTLRTEDLDVKFNYQVHIVPLVKSGKITELGHQYLLGLTQAFKKLTANFNVDQLATYILSLPRIEQWLIKTEVDYHYQRKQPDSNSLVWVLLNNLPFMQVISDGGPRTRYLVPSSSVINYCLSKLNEEPMRMRPVLGNPGLKTLYNWHAQDFHPVALYAKQIISNPKNADGYRCGPFPMWLHDIGHTFWASMLSKSERDFIFILYIPALHGLKEVAEKYGDHASIIFLKEIEKKAFDFDLTAISDYQDKTLRLKTFIAHTMGKSPIYPSCLYTGTYEYEVIGRAEGDTFYFLLHCGLYDPKLPESYKNIYKTLISFITTGKSYRDPRIIKALKMLAKNWIAHPEVLLTHDPPQCEVKILDWQMLLNSDRTSKELWFEMTDNQDLASELLGMIEQGLNFFHPYLPMTPTKRRALLDLLEKQWSKTTKISIDRCSSGNIKEKFQPQFFSAHEDNLSSLLSMKAYCYKI